MWKQLTALSALALFGLASPAQDKMKSEEGRAPAGQKVPLEGANRKNPVESSPDSIAEGKQWYGIECSMCHGKEGDGKGELAQDMKWNLRDWRDSSALQGFTDGELFQIISKGKGTNGSCGTLCTAVTGYDYVTGLGSPQANNVIPALVSQ